MAGAGWKVFSAGAVLTAAEVNTYLMDQSVQVFAGTAARGSAIGTAAAEGMMSYRTDENVLETYDGSQWVPSTSMTPTSLTGRNMLYNSAMQVAQRGTATTGIVSVNTYGAADRWFTSLGSAGTWTMSQETDAPTGSGFRKSSKLLATVGTASPGISANCVFMQTLEGQDVQRIKKGTSSAEKVTLSFWVKSNVTGTYVVQLEDSDNSRSVSASYTVSASATWEKKVVTFPADTTGALDNDNAGSLSVEFWLVAGSNYSGGTLGTTWASTTNANRAVGQVNVAAAANNYWQITGVQLEVGPVATPFEFEPYETTLRKCQRYYWRTTGNYYFGLGTAYSTTGLLIPVTNPVPLRAIATSVDFGTLRAYDGANPATNVTAMAIAVGSGINITMFEPTASSLTQYRPYHIINTTTVSYLGASAEL